MSNKTADIQFRVTLDETHMPVGIEWSATDAPAEAPRATKCVMLSVWNDAERKAMTIDLWTKEMLVDEMKLFVWQNLLAMADTLERATSESDAAQEMRRFARRFASNLVPEPPVGRTDRP